MQLLLGPVLAIVEPAYYRRVAREPIGRALLYVLYLSGLTAVGFALILWRWWLPDLDELAAWTSTRLPAIVFTADGVESAVEQPFVLEHPTYGTLLRLDTSRDTPDLVQPAFVSIGRRQMAVAYDGDADGTPEYRVWDVTPAAASARAAWVVHSIDGASALETYRRARAWAWVLVGAMLGLVFAWKVLAGVCYSAMAHLTALVLHVELPYATTLGLTLFALTPVTVLQWLGWSGLTPPPGPGLSAAVTAAYVLLAVRSAGHAGGEPDAA